MTKMGNGDESPVNLRKLVAMKSVLVCCCILIMLTFNNAFGADNVRDMVTGREPSFTWHNNDGSRTYRYDRGGTTSFEHRSAQNIQADDAFIAALLAPVVEAAVNGACEFYAWSQAPETKQQMRLVAEKVKKDFGNFISKGNRDRQNGLNERNPGLVSAAVVQTPPMTPPRPKDSLDILMGKAKKGDPEAQFQLGCDYYNGRGTTPDYAQAYAWLDLASQRNKDAEELKSAIMKLMTPEQRAEGQRLRGSM